MGSCQMMRHTVILLVFLSPCAFAENSASIEALSLEQAIKVAVEHNHDIRSTSFAVDSAYASTVIASEAPNPVMTVQTFGINPRAGIGAGGMRNKTVDSTLRIDQLIERGGKREFRTENASHLVEAARNDMRDAFRLLRVSVAQAYYNLLAAQEKFVILRQTAVLYDSTVAAAQKRLKAGDIANADVARLQVDALRARNDTVQAEADQASARLAIALLLGRAAYSTGITLADGWPAAQFDVVRPVQASLEQRPDVQAARLRFEAALAGRKLALASRTMDVSVGVQYEHYPSSEANPQGSGNSYGVALQIPLFVRHQFDGEIRAAEAAVDTARENLEKTRDLALGDLMNSWQSARSSFERVQRYDEDLLGAAKKSSDSAEFAFKHGALGVMDVLDARRTYRGIQLDALAARADYAKSLAAWKAAISEGDAQ